MHKQTAATVRTENKTLIAQLQDKESEIAGLNAYNIELEKTVADLMIEISTLKAHWTHKIYKLFK